MNNLRNGLRLLRTERELEKQIKKVIFLFISIIFPLFELVFLILQSLNIYYNLKKSSGEFLDIDTIKIGIGVFSILSMMCTWSMLSLCYNKGKNIYTALIFKFVLIGIILTLSFKSFYFNYYLVFNIVGYGIFYTMIFIYRSFKKRII